MKLMNLELVNKYSGSLTRVQIAIDKLSKRAVEDEVPRLLARASTNPRIIVDVETADVPITTADALTILKGQEKFFVDRLKELGVQI